ncbi:MAG: hypothetical protein IJ963_01350 [Phascolarctobacterium sp.]|nr:hypothetical protein [Phascolarctobacterium sp.]
MDKHNDIEIRLAKIGSVQWLQEVISVSGNNSELLNAVYKELAEKLGMDTAMNIYQLFKGQQINFPIRFFNPNKIQELIVQEYDGSNVRTLATKYNYSEKTIRRIIKESVENNT